MTVVVDERVVARVKRSDLPTREVLAAVARYDFSAWERLLERYPSNLVRAAFQRDIDLDLLDYGVSLERPWLTEAGKAYLDGGE